MLKTNDRWQLGSLLALYVVWFGLGIASLQSYPAPHIDEAWFASPVQALQQTGQLVIPIFGDTSGMLQSQGLWRGFAYLLLLWSKGVGFGLMQARLFSMLAVGLTGLLLFWFGRRAIHAQAGIFVTAFYLLSLRVFAASHVVRPDTWVHLFGVLAWVAGWKLLTTPRLPIAWVAVFGFWVTASADLYPLVLYFTASAACAVAVYCLQQRKWAWLASLVAGALVGITYYVVLHFLPNPLQQLQAMRSVQQAYADKVIQPSGWQAIADYFTAFLIPYVLKQGILGYSRLAPIEFVLGLGGLVVLLFQRSPRNWFLLLAGAFLWVGFLFPYKGLNHLVEFSPWVSILCTIAVFNLGGLWRVGMRRFEAPAWLKRLAGRWSAGQWALAHSLPIWLASIAAAAVLAQRSQPIRVAALAQQIQTYLPQQTPISILGESTWWWFLPAQRYTSDEFLRIYQDAHPEQTADAVVAHIMQQHTVNILLLDEHFSHFEMATSPLLQQALRDYAAAHCTPQGQVSGMGYGVEVGGPFVKQTDIFLCQPNN